MRTINPIKKLIESIDEAEAIKRLRNTAWLERTCTKLEGKLSTIPTVGTTLAYVPTMIQLVTDYIKGNYRNVSPVSIVIAGIALAYVLAPIDVIPDLTPLVGFTDDATVVGVSLNSIKNELDKYRLWKNAIVIQEA